MVVNASAKALPQRLKVMRQAKAGMGHEFERGNPCADAAIPWFVELLAIWETLDFRRGGTQCCNVASFDLL
jgi:hypothetical protein